MADKQEKKLKKQGDNSETKKRKPSTLKINKSQSKKQKSKILKTKDKPETKKRKTYTLKKDKKETKQKFDKSKNNKEKKRVGKKLKITKSDEKRCEDVQKVINEGSISMADRPVLLLQYITYLSMRTNKYVTYGYENVEFQPMIVLVSGFSYVNFKIEDWLMCFSIQMKERLDKWFSSLLECNDDENCVIQLQNHTIRFYSINNNRLVHIEENEPKTRKNDGMFLNACEFEACVLYESYMPKERHLQSFSINEYYNMYVFYCSIKNKEELDTEDFFTHQFDSSQSNLIDERRLFREIPLLCRDKLKKDLEQFRNQALDPKLTLDSQINVI